MEHKVLSLGGRGQGLSRKTGLDAHEEKLRPKSQVSSCSYALVAQVRPILTGVIETRTPNIEPSAWDLRPET